MKYIGRAILIAVMAGAFGITAILFRLPGNGGEARADVWQVFSGVVREIPKFIHATEGDGDIQSVDINGNRLYYRNIVTNRSAKEVLDYYEAEFRKREYNIAPGKLRDDPKVASILKNTEDLVNAAAPRITRVDGEGLSYLGYLDLGTGDFLTNYSLRGGGFAKTGNVDYMGVGKAILAFDEGPGRTSVLSLWTGKDFDIYKFIPVEGADAEGNDIPDLPRMPDSQRLLSTRERDSSALVGVGIYKLDKSVQSCMVYYLDALREKGWVKNPIYESADVAAGENDTMLYAKNGRELQLSFEENGEGGTMMTAIERNFGG